MKILKDKKTGLYMREGTLDEYVIREQSGYAHALEHVKGKVVLDIGGNIGAFAYTAIEQGAKMVHSFEPEPDNIKMFKKQNLENVKLYEYAVFNEDGEANFYVNTQKNKGTHTLRETRGRDCITVKTIALEKVLNKIKPDMIKIDIEGGEYFLDFNLIFNCKSIKYIAMEIHLTTKETHDKGLKLIKQLQKHFTQLNTFIDTEEETKSWTKLFIGVRK